MSIAAVALALAVLIAPADVRRRLPGRAARRRMRLPRRTLVVVGCAAAGLGLWSAVPLSVLTAAAAVAATVALRVRRRRARSRRVTEAEALHGALEVLVSELRVGAHPVPAFEVAARESEGAVATSLRAVAARARLGADVTAGLRDVAGCSALPSHWTRIAVCWELAQTQGLAIATLMQAAQRDIAERQRFSSRVEASMAGARATAGVLAALPVLGIGLGQMIGADPVAFLTGGGAGGAVLVTGVCLSCAGLLWSDRITAGVLT